MTVGGDCIVYVVGFTTTYAIGVYHHLRWGVLDTILCDEDCLVTFQVQSYQCRNCFYV
jgi:hypothetical protein